MKFQVKSTVVGGLILALVFVSAPVPSRATEEAGPQISRKEAKQLIRGASSKQDYQKLSAFFEQKAQSLEAKAREHKEEAEKFASGLKYQPKVPFPGAMVLHCRFLASEYKLEAQKARGKADQYRALIGA